jgi:hypothetical protein
MYVQYSLGILVNINIEKELIAFLLNNRKKSDPVFATSTLPGT